jgi:hypothetical protein
MLFEMNHLSKVMKVVVEINGGNAWALSQLWERLADS